MMRKQNDLVPGARQATVNGTSNTRGQRSILSTTASVTAPTLQAEYASTRRYKTNWTTGVETLP